MNCPVCNLEMRTSDREGIDIQYCTKCGGVWLERGKLEKIVARTADADGSGRQDDRGEDRGDDDGDFDDDGPPARGNRGDRSPDRQRRPGGLRGFLGSLFESD
jgi:Zn-finger nucleic acid-binding protein